MLPTHHRVFDFDNHFDNHFANVENIFDWAFPDRKNASVGEVMPVDAQETETGYQFLIDVPGMSQEDLNIQIQNRILVIEGQRQSEHADQKDGYYIRERWSGSFSRSIRLPAAADISNIQATLRNGVLTLTICKTEAAKPLKIEIK